MTTVKLEIWRDTGFTEGAVEVPSRSSTLGSPSHTFNGLNIARDRLFSQVHVRAPYEDLYDCSYIRMTYDMNNGDDVVVYGWVDSVQCSSDTLGAPMTVIDWHVDHWRTYIGKVTCGAGLVTRRAPSDDMPPQIYPERYRRAVYEAPLIPESGTWWVVFTFTQRIPIIEATLNCVGAYPVDVDFPSSNITMSGPTQIDGSGDIVTIAGPSLDQTAAGVLEEVWNLDPNAIKSCFISPIPPIIGSYEPYSSNGWVAYNGGDELSDGTPYGFLYHAMRVPLDEFTVTLPESSVWMTTDVSELVVTGFDGEVIGRLPWGLRVDTVKSRLIVDAVSAYIEFRLVEAEGYGYKRPLGNSEGLTYQIPLVPITITENSWSSYVYSGARSADVSARNLQMLHTGLNMVGGGKGIISGAVDLLTAGLSTGVQDTRVRNVTPSYIMSGTGWDLLDYGWVPTLLSLNMDDYSRIQRSQDMELYGCHVSEATQSCEALVDAGGPLRIRDLAVTGSVPVEAKRHIRERFAQGVRLMT